MRPTSIAALLFAVQMAPIAVLARGTIKEADYPVEYEIVNTTTTAKRVIEKQCSMTLRDRAKTDLYLNVERTGYGSCGLLVNGKVYRGRENQRKNRIEIVIPVGADKARIENWQIVGIVNNPPGTSPASRPHDTPIPGESDSR